MVSKHIIRGGNKHVADNMIRNQIGIQENYKDKPTKLRPQINQSINQSIIQQPFIVHKFHGVTFTS